MNAGIGSLERLALEHIPQYLAGHSVPWLAEARQQAFARFAAHGLPTRAEEEWRYTDVAPLGRRETLAPDVIPPDPPSEAALYAWALAQQDVHLMVFVNGHYCGELSAAGALPAGVHLHSLAAALDSAAELPQAWFEQQHEHTIFAALNNALATDGAVLKLDAGAVLDKPLYLLFIAGGHGSAIYPRNLVVAAEGAHATIIEHHYGMLEAHSFTDTVTQLSLAPGADVTHCKLVQDSKAAFHIGGVHAEQADGSRFLSQSFVLDGRLVRNDITVRLAGPGCRCALDGLYLLGGRQHVDHHTRIDHFAPDGTSREHYRGILDDEARGVFSGRVVVHPHAIRTDAHQSSRNLLLSGQAEVDTKPQLEIYADDVKCTHGATVGQLDENHLFYLRARGIDPATARSLLIYGFANDITSKVDDAGLRNRIDQLVLDRLPQGDAIKELL